MNASRKMGDPVDLQAKFYISYTISDGGMYVDGLYPTLELAEEGAREQLQFADAGEVCYVSAVMPLSMHEPVIKRTEFYKEKK